MIQAIKTLLLLNLCFLVCVGWGTKSASTDVDGKPLIAELVDKLNTCDVPGPEIPADAGPIASQETTTPNANLPDVPSTTSDNNMQNPVNNPTTESITTDRPSNQSPNVTTNDAGPQSPPTKCGNMFRECLTETKLCLNKTYKKMMHLVCMKACGVC